VNNLAPKDRDIAMVFQNYALYPHKTVAENMSFALKLRHTPKAEVERGAPRRRILDVTPYLKRYPRQLPADSVSGGDGRRSARSAGFLFDEPLSTSTPSCACRCERKSRSCTSAEDHDHLCHARSSRGDDMADRIVVMRDGVVEQADCRSTSTTGRRRCSSPDSSARRDELLQGSIRVDGAPSFVTEGGVKLPLKSAPSDRTGGPAFTESARASFAGGGR